MAEDYGRPIIDVIHNFTLGIEDILKIEYGTAQRVLRYNKRLFEDTFFEDNIGTLGVFFEAMELL